MLKRLLIAFVAIVSFSCDKNECVIRPVTPNISDSYIANIYPNLNYGVDAKFLIMNWTYNSQPHNVRGLIKFNMEKIPKNAHIQMATLTLFADTLVTFQNSPYPDRGHYGNGSWFVRRLTANWDEKNIKWNSRPSHTDEDIVILAPASFYGQSFVIDVTHIVRKQLKIDNFGFEVGFVNKIPYERMVFHSSNSQYKNLRPKLDIQY